MKAMNFQNDNPSTPIDIFEDHYVPVFDLTSTEDATEIFSPIGELENHWGWR